MDYQNLLGLNICQQSLQHWPSLFTPSNWKSPKEFHADQSQLLMIVMFILCTFLQRQGAQLVVLEGKQRNVWENTWSASCLDLHLMSSGAARAMVHAWLLNIRSIVFEGHELPNLLRY